MANPQCHYLRGWSLERCTGESVNPNADVGPLLCQRHIAEVMAFVRDNVRIAKAKEAAK